MLFETWADLITGLDAFFTFARSLGLDDAIPGSRFAKYRSRLAELDGVLQREGTGVAFTRFTSGIEENAVALTESQELVTILPFLQSVPTARAKKKLAIVL